ncbi:MAG TPA: sigma-70 family RNA polymerase sigma factor [Pyrinomonadaceae bacterium]|nr:sigma-70 family RNA polymerase sigma factor [Pyrinomonadaceae bacterium]
MSDDKCPSDDELRDANELVKKYREKLYNTIVKYLHAKHCKQPREHAEGVCSCAWINALRSLHTVQDWTKFEGWLVAIAINEARRHLTQCIRREKRDAELDEALLPRAQLTDYYHSRDAAIDVDQMLSYVESLSEDLGSIFRLRYIRGLTFDEIAQRLGKSTENIRTLHYRALRKIREKFNYEDTDTGVEDNTEETDARDEH